jgi:hypothetical protein
MIPLNLDKIRNHLQKQGIQSELQSETDQLCALFKVAEKEYPLFFRIYEGGELLQLLAFLPCSTKTTTIADTARLLHLLNKEIDLPGFGMDESQHVVFYRLMCPVKEKKLDLNLFNSYVNATQVVCQSFATVIAAIAYGGITFEDMLKKVQENNGQSLSNAFLQKGRT